MHMETEEDYYRNLKSLTKVQLLKEIQFLREQVRERQKLDHIERSGLEESRRSERAHKDKIGTRRFMAFIAAVVIFGIGYAFYPGLLRVMAFVFVIYLLMELQLGE